MQCMRCIPSDVVLPYKGKCDGVAAGRGDEVVSSILLLDTIPNSSIICLEVIKEQQGVMLLVSNIEIFDGLTIFYMFAMPKFSFLFIYF